MSEENDSMTLYSFGKCISCGADTTLKNNRCQKCNDTDTVELDDIFGFLKGFKYADKTRS